MTVEIQTLVFAHNIKEYPNGLVDLLLAPIFRQEPHDRVFPARMNLSFYLLLRKETYDSSLPTIITLKIIDQDGRAVQLLEGNSLVRTGTFEPGERFLGINGELNATFPGPGAYSVTASVESDGHTAEQIYVIEMFSS